MAKRGRGHKGGRAGGVGDAAATVALGTLDYGSSANRANTAARSAGAESIGQWPVARSS